MTAGHGVSHSEETEGVYTGALHGIQLWVAQPEATRDGEPAFEHIAELPRTGLQRGIATVLVGEFVEVSSPARRDTDHMGVELELRSGPTDIPLEREFEYGVVVLDGAVSVAGRSLVPPTLGYLGVGRDELRLEVADAARVLLIGGRPFPEPLLMWWNYVARSRAEVVDAHHAWTTGEGRFGHVASPLAPMSTAGPPWS